MQFSSANQKNHISYCYQGHSRCHSKKHVALGARMCQKTKDYATVCQSLGQKLLENSNEIYAVHLDTRRRVNVVG